MFNSEMSMSIKPFEYELKVNIEINSSSNYLHFSSQNPQVSTRYTSLGFHIAQAKINKKY